MKIPEFVNYRKDIPDNRVMPYKKETFVPNNVQSKMRGIGVNSVTEFLNYTSANPRHCDVVSDLTGLSEDALARLKEDVRQKLESHRMIDERCGQETDPCATLPRKIIRIPAPRMTPQPCED